LKRWTFVFCLIQLSFPLEWGHDLYFTHNQSLFWNCMITFFWGLL
jgi:hypothetical protein